MASAGKIKMRTVTIHGTKVCMRACYTVISQGWEASYKIEGQTVFRMLPEMLHGFANPEEALDTIQDRLNFEIKPVK